MQTNKKSESDTHELFDTSKDAGESGSRVPSWCPGSQTEGNRTRHTKKTACQNIGVEYNIIIDL